jgi:drug/metabolite transporter (DMT)-like permease
VRPTVTLAKNTERHAMSLKHWAMILALSVLWGGSFLFQAVAVREVPPLTVALARVAGGAAVLALVMLALARLGADRSTPSDVRWSDYAVMGFLANALPFALIISAQAEIPSGLASLLNAATPISTVIVAHAFGAERATGGRIVGVLLGVVGVAILIGPAALAGQKTSVFGMLAVVAATISYGFASLWGRRFKTVSPLFTAMAQLACSAVMLAPLVLLIERPWTVPAPSMGASAALVGLAVLSTALAFVIFFRVMAEAGALNAMLVTLLVPISATAFGVVLLGETITTRQILGAAVIAAALAILDGRIVRWAGTSLRGR